MPLRDVSADRGLRIRLGLLLGSSLMALMLAAEFARYPDRVMLLLVPDAVVTAGVVWLVWRAIEAGGGSAAGVHFPSADGTPRAHEYSLEHALVVRGSLDEAVESYRSRIVAYPGEIEARLRLAALLADECHDPDGATRCLLEIRMLGVTLADRWKVTNALIDIYRALGNVPALRSELLRLALEHPDTAAGRAARAEAATLA